MEENSKISLTQVIFLFLNTKYKVTRPKCTLYKIICYLMEIHGDLSTYLMGSTRYLTYIIDVEEKYIQRVVFPRQVWDKKGRYLFRI